MLPGMNERAVKAAMKKMGVKQEEIPASEVIIKAEGRDIMIRNPQVMRIEMMGQESFQVSGEVSERAAAAEEDVRTVMEQADVSEDDAREALEAADGDMAKAILSLSEK